MRSEGLIDLKVLLTFSPEFKLRNFEYSTEAMAVAPHLLIYPLALVKCRVFDIIKSVWAIVLIRAVGNAKT